VDFVFGPVGMRIVNNSGPIHHSIQIADLSGYKYPNTKFQSLKYVMLES
jgi:hypothetical protein